MKRIYIIDRRIIQLANSLLTFILSFFICCSFSSCKKFLETKPDKSLQVPATLQDCKALLAETTTINGNFISEGEMGADNASLTFEAWNSKGLLDREGYVWKADADVNHGRWLSGYLRVLNANQVLETLSKIVPSANEQSLWNQLKGTALFLRAFSYYDMAQIWTVPYDRSTANTDMGIPIHLTPSVDEKTGRGTVQQTYDRILQDLNEAVNLLPDTPPITVISKYTLLTRSAALGALARTYLAMGDYANAGLNADACLTSYDVLMDYKQLDQTNTYPIPSANSEIIFSAITGIQLFDAFIDASIYQSYHNNDLRRKLFFKDQGNQTYIFTGSYNGSPTYEMFNGLATDEIYLIRSECYARAGKTTQALEDLNTLMKNRWEGIFTPFTAINAGAALDLILKERRKELLFRGLRWTDLRRLNKESRFAIALKRNLNGQEYQLVPNDLRYTLLIPSLVLQRVNIPQNKR